VSIFFEKEGKGPQKLTWEAESTHKKKKKKKKPENGPHNALKPVCIVH
jgi:hypothetical protein